MINLCLASPWNNGALLSSEYTPTQLHDADQQWAHMGWWGGCPGSWKHREDWHSPAAQSPPWQMQCSAGWLQLRLMKKERIYLPLDSLWVFFLFQHDYQFLRQVKLDKLKWKIKRLHGCVLALNSKNRLFHFSLWTVKAPSVSLRIASCLHETFPLHFLTLWFTC